jgi:methionyl-tRNA synthetase
VEANRLHEALAAAMNLARVANGYVEEREPWALAKDPARVSELDETLSTLARVLTALVALFEPVAPTGMAELARRLGLEGVPTLDEALDIDLRQRSVTAGSPLFPRSDRRSGSGGSGTG